MSSVCAAHHIPHAGAVRRWAARRSFHVDHRTVRWRRPSWRRYRRWAQDAFDDLRDKGSLSPAPNRAPAAGVRAVVVLIDRAGAGVIDRPWPHHLSAEVLTHRRTSSAPRPWIPSLCNQLGDHLVGPVREIAGHDVVIVEFQCILVKDRTTWRRPIVRTRRLPPSRSHARET